jgi:signal peptidase I
MSETVKFLLNAAAVVLIGLVVVRLAFMETVVVADNGMAPTLVYGDEVLVWKGAEIEMADVVVCEHPVRTGALVISRAIAFAGHTVSTDINGTLYVDKDRTTTQPVQSMRFYDVTRKRQWDMRMYLIDYFGRHSHQYFIERGDMLRLPTHTVERGVYLLGDNRSELSFDSRDFGEVHADRCLGQVIMRLRPAPSRGDDLTLGYLDLIE